MKLFIVYTARDAVIHQQALHWEPVGLAKRRGRFFKDDYGRGP